jgi:hypothetical protein
MHAAPGPPYHIAVDPRAGSVAAWSTARLPFEPKGWMRAFRDELAGAVADLRAAPRQLLYAGYTSADRAFVDTENVLIYNLGPGHFQEAARHGLRFERAYGAPRACPVPLNALPTHYYAYHLTGATTPLVAWSLGHPLARLTAHFPEPGALRRPETAWYAAKTGTLTVLEPPTSELRSFALRVRVDVPDSAVVAPALLLKPLFDGILSALHSHDGTAAAQVVARLAGRLGADPAQIHAYLHDGRGAILGRRRLVYLRAAGLQWNPRDDACLVGELVLRPATAGGAWQVSAEALALAPAIPHGVAADA